MLHSSSLGKIHKRLIALIVCLASLAGCTMGTSTTGNGPSGISATTLSPTSIRVYWTRDPTDLSTDTVIVMLGSTIVGTATASSPLDSALITGLTSNVPYTIIIATATIRSQPVNYTLQLTYLPTNVAVIAEDSVSITVSWTRNFNDTSSDTLYVTTLTGGLAGNSPIIVPAGKDTGIVTGLTAGVTYIITIASSTGYSTAIQYTVPGVPTNLLVNTMNATSIGVKWSRGVNDTIADTIVAMNGNTVVSTSIIPYSLTATDSMGIVSGLSEDVPYLITVHVNTGISDSIIWMTAERTNGIQIYEMSDTLGDPRGLQLAINSTKAIGLPSATKPDFVLDTNSTLPSGISLDAGDSANMNGNATKVNPSYNLIRGGLDSNYRGSNYTSTLIGDTVVPIIIPSDTQYNLQGSLVLICQTVNSNLALIEIVPNATTGQLYSTAANGFKYITVNVSYQAYANEPYAGRGHPGAVKPAPKKSTRIIKPVLRNAANTIRPITSNPVSNIKPVTKTTAH